MRTEGVMVERVARAMYNKKNNLFGCPTWEAAPFKEHYIDLAKAAIEAMREPTKDMLQASCDLHKDDTWWDHSTAPPTLMYKLGAAGPTDDWRAMIDEALK